MVREINSWDDREAGVSVVWFGGGIMAAIGRLDKMDVLYIVQPHQAFPVLDNDCMTLLHQQNM